MDMCRLAKIKRRLLEYNGNRAPISINTALELVELAEKGFRAQRLEREAQWLARHCASFVIHSDAEVIRRWREAAARVALKQEQEENNGL